MKLLSSDLALEAVEGFRSILQGFTKDSSLAHGYFDADLGTLWKDLISGGWHLLGAPEERNGAGFDLVDLTAISTEWGKYLLPLPFIPTLLISRWSDVSREVDQTTMLTYSLPATPGEEGGAGLSPFGGLSGATLIADLSTLSHFNSSVSEIDGGAETDSWAPSMPLFRNSGITLGMSPESLHEIAVLGAAELVGVGVVVLDLASKYAHERIQFGRPIAEFQGVQHRLADMQRDLEMARIAVIWAANDQAKSLTAVQMAWDRARRMTQNCIQIHGGYGFTWESGLHYYNRHVVAWGELLTACGIRRWSM